ncbi:hypothetical protein ACFO25_04680 [Paenactinomyces guangxiensis]|uniref:Uncharacterized protein n=1 Tax=Paenactinomyces guangxiensis TaxID=1490290 RepID=A0A7W1WPF5_9BACL|nr:hypothetical protein [Paenactinomyces guangxiensis]MBA4493673.1 hypothetical protein [Paenactinomyces guangxiensis]MBH8590960.1 hypothetical protein [Paenactinomyces guangxiensis]
MDVEICHVLLTIRRACFQQIVSGIKKYEFRRRYVNQPSIAFIYVPTPVQAIRSVIQFGQPIVDSVKGIADIAEASQKGAGEQVEKYFAGLDRGYAIPVMHVKELKPITIYEIKRRFPVFTPPQSYLKLENKPDILRYLVMKATYIHQVEFLIPNEVFKNEESEIIAREKSF